MHSDLDADRMDYLMRDSHYTGIKYGQFDREYIMANLATYEVTTGKYKGQVGFGVRENALRAVEDFLIARFNWYSQVVKNPGSAKFDILSTKVAEEFLNMGWIHQFHDILEMVESGDERFFWWNDIYFMTRCQDARLEKKFKGTVVGELVEMLLYRKAPKTMPHPDFTHRILPDVGADESRESRIRKLHSRLKEMQKIVAKKGSGKDWILADIPQKDVAFTTGTEGLKKLKSSDPEKLARDPVKIVSRDGSAKMLVEIENSLMRTLSGYTNFVPSVYASEGAYKILRDAYRVSDTKSKKG
jgi:HD superfamily phosphohydrolase